MSLRGINTDVRGSLLKEEPFVYAHLIKFERVIKTQSSKPSESATDYSYITDASVDILWDDESKDVEDGSNGAQTYIANRLLKVGGINETTEAKATNLAVTLSSVALGATYTAAAGDAIILTPDGANATLELKGEDDWLERGFSEGDKITITCTQNADWNKSLTINSFTVNNKKAHCKFVERTGFPTAAVDSDPTGNGVVTGVTIDLSTDEIAAILNNPNDTTYAGYINREVFIYKAHINPETGEVIGADVNNKGGPYLIFKGIIAKARLQEDPSKDSKVTWNLTSHWGDFVRVNGRITSDSEHRAISTKGTSDPSALHRYEYAGDYGFMHSEQAINIIAIYQVMETRYKMKSSGLFGFKKKLKEYQVEVDREVDLRLNLEAKHLPVVYGVNRVDSIPIFADSLYNDAATIYVIYAICEGEVSGLYDIYVDDQSRICVDKNDSDTRSTQTSEKTIDVICEGRMDRGDTLSSSPSSNRGAGYWPGLYYGGYGGWWGGLGAYWQGRGYGRNTAPVTNTNSDAGITHEKQTDLEYPIKTTLQFHAGRPYQRSNDMITNIAVAGKSNATNGFKLQGDLDYKDNYWSSSHRLLDTAYAVAEYEIAEGDVTIPELDFVIRGKEIDQYNYDYSYRLAPNVNTTTAATLRSTYYKVGDTVDFYKGDGTALAQDVQILDLTKYINSREEEVWKYRFASDPLVNNPTQTVFKMVVNGQAHDHASAYWMATWDHKVISSTSLTKTLVKPVTTNSGDGNATAGNNNNGGIDLTTLPTDLQSWINFIAAQGGLTIAFSGGSFTITAEDLLENLAQIQLDSAGSDPNVANNAVTNAGQGSGEANEIDYVFLTNAIYLGDASGIKTSTTENPTLNDDYYKGHRIKITQTLDDGSIKTQTREIIGYDASEKIAYTGSIGPAEQNVTTAGTFTVATSTNGMSTSVTLTGVSGLATGQIISKLSVSPNPTAYIPVGTKITNIAGNTITLDQAGYFPKNATITANVSTNSAGTIVTPEPFSFVPMGTDQSSVRKTKWEILPLGDTKVSINPAAQLLDYLTSERYGKGLDLDKDIDLDSFKEVMRACDTRSDVTLAFASGTFTVGDKYQLISTIESVDYLQWQGTVKSVYTTPNSDMPNGETRTYKNYPIVTFTDCIGKIAHKWYDWKSYEKGNWIYHKIGDVNKLYKRDSAGTTGEPSSGNESTLSITKVGGSSVNVFIGASASSGTTKRESSWDHNPVVKDYDADKDNFAPSGYSLYDSDDVKYWRYLGWQEHNQREVTRHQTNCTIRTETPVFDNVNSMLEHFNGILRYSDGKYNLGIKTQAPTIPTTITYDSIAYADPRKIHADDIIGTISVDDAGLKGSANTVSVGISDPAIRYDKRSVSFYNSDYLKEDRGVPKKKSVKTPLITNYFNARMNAEQYLIDSRFSRKISFQLGPQGVLLLAGTIVWITYPRFKWVDKAFRISNLQVREDCLVQVTAEEHEDSVYKIGNKTKKPGEDPSNTPGGSGVGEGAKPSSPTALAATTDQNNQINLTWDNAGGYGQTVVQRGQVKAGINWATVIYRNDNSSFSGGTGAKAITSILATTPDSLIDSYEDALPGITADKTYYYWIKHVRNGIPSLWHPASGNNPGTGVTGTAIATPVTSGADVYLYKAVTATPAADQISADTDFPILVVTMDGGANHGTITGVKSGQDADMAITNGQIIDGAGAGTGWYTTVQDVSENKKNLYQVHAHVSTANDTVDVYRASAPSGAFNWGTITRIGSFGSIGEDGDSGPRHTHGFVYYSTGQATSPGNPTADSYSFTNSAFTNLAAGWSLQAPTATPGTTSSKYWYATFTAKEGVTNGSGTGATTGTDGSLTFGTAYEGLNFTGLVTFTALSTDGSTTIHGGNITTGTIAAARISLTGKNVSELTNDSGYTNDNTANAAQSTANTANLTANSKNKTFYSDSSSTPTALVVGDIWVQTDKVDVFDKYKIATATGTGDWENMNPAKVGAWNIDTNSIWSGTKVDNIATTFSSDVGNDVGHITFNSGGSIHTPWFYSNKSGAGFRGTVTVSGTNLAASHLTQVQGAFDSNATISGGYITLSSETSGGTTNTIVLNSVGNKIEIKEGDTTRVLLGKL